MPRRVIAEKIVYWAFPHLKLVKQTYEKLNCAITCFKTCKHFKSLKMKLPIKIGIGSVGMFLFIIIFGWVAFPKILSNKIKTMVSLKKGNDVREMYLKVPFPLTFKVYLFNTTNPTEITEKGAIPIVQEVGPFIYDEWKEKVDIEEDEASDTMSYSIKNTFIYNQELTSPLTGNEMITLLHPMIAGVVYVVEKDKPAALSLLNKAIVSIYSSAPESPFLRASAKDILFDGVLIYCNVTDFAGKAVCGQLKSEATDLIEVEEGIFKFSLFGPKNGTKGQRVKVKRGIENFHDLGKVIEFEGERELKIWAGKECNTYVGTDSTIFPPFLTEEEGLVSFAPDICRSLSAYFIENTKYAGLPVRRYSADFGDMSTNEKEKCYCPTPETCLKKGVVDLQPCLGAPLLASLPHFYLSDPSYVNGVKGLNPNEKDHEIIILFEHMTGSPVSAKKRLQFSMGIHPVPKIAMMKEFPTTILPLMWVEEGVDLNATWTGQLNNQLFRVLKIAKVAKYIILLGSIVGMGVAGYMYFMKKTVQITPIHNTDNDDKRKNIISMLAQNDKDNFNRGQINHGMSNNEIDKY